MSAAPVDPAIVIAPVEPAQTRPLRQRVLRPHESLATLAAHELTGAHMLGGWIDGELRGTGSIIETEEPGVWRIRAMAVDAQARGRGLGSAILAGLLDHARRRGATRIWCNARTPALSLYARAGFGVVSDEFELPDIGPHRRMELTLAG